jgi:hypothetical protein
LKSINWGFKPKSEIVSDGWYPHDTDLELKKRRRKIYRDFEVAEKKINS